MRAGVLDTHWQWANSMSENRYIPAPHVGLLHRAL